MKDRQRQKAPAFSESETDAHMQFMHRLRHILHKRIMREQRILKME